jgi:hypothetical protein
VSIAILFVGGLAALEALMLNPEIEGPDWMQAHCDKLVERAVKAEMQRDELLRIMRYLISHAAIEPLPETLAPIVRHAISKAMGEVEQ